jgi:hypothetical protein
MVRAATRETAERLPRLSCLNGVSAVAVDRAGNIYIADTNNFRIRKVTEATGKISTVTGNGTKGYSGDGGAAANAEISGVYGLAVDQSGNVYIADYQNQRIRVVNTGTAQITLATVVIPAGDIANVAGDGTQGYSGDGGPATSAAIENPQGVAVDSEGDIYIAGSFSHRVREVAASTGFISTVAGDGKSGFSGDDGPATSAEVDPYSVVVDSTGNLYIVDYDNQRIRMVFK